MNRTILAIATALLSASTLFASAAQACISCSYVPEVVNTPVRGQSTYQKKRTYVAAKEASVRPSKKRPAKIAIAKAEPVKKLAPKKVDTAKITPVEVPKSDSKPIETASLTDAEAAPSEEIKAAVEEPKVTENVGCKKFIPTVGVTVTVPCE
jgi:hypothetical protein